MSQLSKRHYCLSWGLPVPRILPDGTQKVAASFLHHPKCNQYNREYEELAINLANQIEVLLGKLDSKSKSEGDPVCAKTITTIAPGQPDGAMQQ
jgi:hypothetical protein